MVKFRPKLCGRKQRLSRAVCSSLMHLYLEMISKLIAIDVQSRREGEVTREVGFYNSRREETQLDISVIIVSWGSGAKLAETVRDIFRRAKLKIT
uniref:Ribosomal protein S16 n=1 Tax=Adiantum shastense TaxID=2052490 RepID=A0A2P1MBJ7_9MONI|nr:ribosomal protein S16 [Adiantum shastense]AVP32749.1 ribosomal protein S16 [Adiantum shastense]